MTNRTLDPSLLQAIDVQLRDGRTIRVSARSKSALLDALIDVQGFQSLPEDIIAAVREGVGA